MLERPIWDETFGEVVYRARREADAGAASAGNLATDPEDVESRRRRLAWSQLIRKVYEIDPLLCPCCGSELRIVAVLVDFASLRRLLAHAPPDQAEDLRAHA